MSEGDDDEVPATQELAEQSQGVEAGITGALVRVDNDRHSRECTELLEEDNRHEGDGHQEAQQGDQHAELTMPPAVGRPMWQIGSVGQHVSSDLALDSSGGAGSDDSVRGAPAEELSP
eukprot:scaffold655080_cov50-Prasinocladus_malaysianus.AAC.1